MKSGDSTTQTSSSDAVTSSNSGGSGSGSGSPSDSAVSSGSGSSSSSQDSQAPLSAKGSSTSENANGAGSISGTNAKGSSTSPPDGFASGASSAADSASAQKPQGSGSSQPANSNAPSSANDDATASSSGSSGGAGSVPGEGSGKTDGNGIDDPAHATPPTLSTHSGVSKAAIAVPLAFVGAALFASLGLCIARDRTMKNERLMRNRSVYFSSTDSYYPSRVASQRSRGEGPSGAHSSPRGYAGGDIEKAIDALGNVGRRSSRSYEKDDHADVMYVPVRTAYPVPREDVRRERVPSILTRAGSYFSRDHCCSDDRDRDGRRRLSFSMRRNGARRRRHNDEIDWENQADYDAWEPYPDRVRDSRQYTTMPAKQPFRRTPFPSLSHFSRRSSVMSAPGDTEDEAGSATEAVLSDYLGHGGRARSTSSRSSRIPVAIPGAWRSNSDLPREPPRSHSRCTAPEMDRRSRSYVGSRGSRFGYGGSRRGSSLRYDDEEGGEETAFFSPGAKTHRTL